MTENLWTLENVVAITDAHLAAKENLAFEAAFSKFSVEPTARRVHEPQTPLTPWYLDKDSGGPNPLFRMPGIRYDN